LRFAGHHGPTLGSGERRAQKRIGVRAWRIAFVIPKRCAEPERRTRHGLLLNDGRRFLDGNKLALYGEINFLASPLHEVSSSVTARDFYSVSSDYNVASLSGVRHNVFAGGAIVLRAALKWSLSS
jgi:hypothetical protein